MSASNAELNIESRPKGNPYLAQLKDALKPQAEQKEPVNSDPYAASSSNRGVVV